MAVHMDIIIASRVGSLGKDATCIPTMVVEICCECMERLLWIYLNASLFTKVLPPANYSTLSSARQPKLLCWDPAP